jgi:multidrug efflux pump subunit AcrB
VLRRLLTNHVLANTTFVLVLGLGIAAFVLLPRQQDPTINFNWIEINTVLPGAGPRDIERRVTEPLEQRIRNVSDIQFVSSTSRESISSILVRFEDIDDDTFDERVADLRREVRSGEDELPERADDSTIREITTANAFPNATVAVTAPGSGERLRDQAQRIHDEMEQLPGVDSILAYGLTEPELQVAFDPVAVEAHGLEVGAIADTVRNYFRDLAAGDVQVGNRTWLVSVEGTTADPVEVGQLPIETAQGEVPLDALATVRRGRSERDTLVRYQGQPAVQLGINKKPKTNTLELVDRIQRYIDQRNAVADTTGVRLVLADDQTEITRNALHVMQTNMVIGLVLVLLVAWLFLGLGISVLTAIAIPFILAGVFLTLFLLERTLNVLVLLGVVISLGMLVDDAVVVVEAIYYRLERGARALEAAIGGLREIFAPITSAVATTIAAFMPLMLLPGILGQFMFLVPLVVTTALLFSLVEAYWMLPAHVTAARIDVTQRTRIQRLRTRTLRRIRSGYTRILAKAMRYPVAMLVSAALLFALALAAVVTETGVRRDFFASEPIRLFYVDVDMPIGTPLEQTLEQAQRVEARVRAGLQERELRSILTYAGRKFTETSPRRGDHYGQLLVALKPQTGDMRNVSSIIEALRLRVTGLSGPDQVSFLKISGGPPTTKPISIKVRGDTFDEIEAAVDDLKAIMGRRDAIQDITDNAELGQMALDLRVDAQAAHRAGLTPAQVARSIQLLVDGETVAAFQHQGEEREVRVFAERDGDIDAVDDLLATTLTGAGGRRVPLKQVVETDRGPGLAAIRHYNHRRAITVEANLDKERMDTLEANQWIMSEWQDIRDRHPNITLDSSGLLDDIKESLDSMFKLFLVGLGLMYLILGTQFRSYFQPLMILVTVPMAFTGVTIGMVVTGNPLSLYTLYGVVALSGIAVNAAIVLVSAANARLDTGMTPLHAILYAARRRVIPILITSLTTIAGLLSLATGLGGESLIWGPVATAIVWGLAVSSVLTLFVVPTLYALTMNRSWRRRGAA